MYEFWSPLGQTRPSLVFDAIARHGNRFAAQAPPPGALNRIDHCLRVLEATGFVDRSAEIVRAEWFLPNAHALIVALSAGTVRMAALIGRKNHQRSPPLLVTSTVALNVSAVTEISQFPSQRCWRVVARP